MKTDGGDCKARLSSFALITKGIIGFKKEKRAAFDDKICLQNVNHEVVFVESASQRHRKHQTGMNRGSNESTRKERSKLLHQTDF